MSGEHGVVVLGVQAQAVHVLHGLAHLAHHGGAERQLLLLLGGGAGADDGQLGGMDGGHGGVVHQAQRELPARHRHLHHGAALPTQQFWARNKNIFLVCLFGYF